MELVAKNSYLGTKYILDNLKKDKLAILHGNFLHGYGVSLHSKIICTKTYYDTPDCFLNQVGITININHNKGTDTELVVRYNHSADRIMFLDNIPDTFTKIITANPTIKANVEFIKESIYEIIPNGISANIEELLKTVKPIMVVEKKGESYRVINASGFKTILTFNACVYNNKLNGRRRKVDILDVQSLPEQKDIFPTFNKDLCFEYPNLISANVSDLYAGIELTSK